MTDQPMTCPLCGSSAMNGACSHEGRWICVVCYNGIKREERRGRVNEFVAWRKSMKSGKLPANPYRGKHTPGHWNAQNWDPESEEAAIWIWGGLPTDPRRITAAEFWAPENAWRAADCVNALDGVEDPTKVPAILEAARAIVDWAKDEGRSAEQLQRLVETLPLQGLLDAMEGTP